MKQPGGYVSLGSVQTNDIDWSRARTVHVDLVDVAFSPDALSFDAGVPYRLVMRNTGLHPHDFVATGFFKAIAARKLIIGSKAIDYPFVQTIDVASGDAKELLFVPVRRGRYALTCTYPNHASLGMEGSVTVR